MEPETLSSAKAALLDRWRAGVAPVEPRTEIDRRAATSWVPSSVQQDILVRRQLESGDPTAYTIHAAYRLPVHVDVAVLERAIALLAERHESLRTTFAVDDADRVVQVIRDEPTIVLHVEDLSEMPARAIAVANEITQMPFDVLEGPLARVGVLTLGPAETLVVFAAHHVIADGWSLRIGLKELGEIYAALLVGRVPELLPIPTHYRDYARWQRENIDETEQKLLAYWGPRLQGLPRPLLSFEALAAERAEPFPTTTERVLIDAPLTDALRLAARAADATLFSVLLAAYGVVLAKVTSTHDVGIGVASANRRLPELLHVIGLFTADAVIRFEVEPVASFTDLARTVHRDTQTALSRLDLPMRWMTRELGMAPIAYHTFFVLQPRLEVADLAGVPLEKVELDTDGGYDGVALELWDGDEVHGVLQYPDAPTDELGGEPLWPRLHRVLERVAADPHRNVVDLLGVA